MRVWSFKKILIKSLFIPENVFLAGTSHRPFSSWRSVSFASDPGTKNSAFKTSINLVFVHLSKLVIFTQNLELDSLFDASRFWQCRLICGLSISCSLFSECISFKHGQALWLSFFWEAHTIETIWLIKNELCKGIYAALHLMVNSPSNTLIFSNRVIIVLWYFDQISHSSYCWFFTHSHENDNYEEFQQNY